MGEVSIKVAMRCRHFAGGDDKVDKRLGVYCDQPSLDKGAEEGTIELLNSNYSTNQFAFSFSWWSAFNWKKWVAPDDKNQEQRCGDMKYIDQQDVYDQIGPMLTDDLMGGNAVVMFAYGLSGSGKTYTVFGPDAADAPEAWFKHAEPEKRWGLFPRIGYDLCKEKAQHPDWVLRMKYFQNVVDTVRDLMPSKPAEQSYKAGMRKDKDGFMDIEWCEVKQIEDWDQLRGTFQHANGRKAIAPTQFNPMSTRGHCVMTLELERPHPERDGMKQIGRLYVCDLAGTEPAGDVVYATYKKIECDDGKGGVNYEYEYTGPHSDSKKTKELQDQGKKINLSLSEMAQFFMKMAEGVLKKTLKPGKSIPGCNSYFLCKYLKDTMLQARTYLFCAIRPEVQYHPYTFSTLGFAKNASVIKLSPKKSTAGMTPNEIKLLKEVEELKALVEALKAGGGGSADTAGLEAAVNAKAAELGAAMSGGGDSGPTQAEIRAEQQRQEYLSRGIHMTDNVADLEEPYFINLDADPYRNERHMYVFMDGETSFGVAGEADIAPMAYGIKSNHCKVLKTEGSNLKIVGGNGEVYVNGKLLANGAELQLTPKDRVCIGNEVLVYRHNGNPADDGTPNEPEAADNEFRAAKSANGGGGGGGGGSGGLSENQAAAAKAEAEAALVAERARMEADMAAQIEAQRAEMEAAFAAKMGGSNGAGNDDEVAKLKKQLEDQLQAAKASAEAKFQHDLMVKQAGTLNLNEAEQQLRELLPLTQYLNTQVFKMMDRGFLHAEATVQTKPMEVKVKLTRNDTQESITIQKHAFMEAYYQLEQQVKELTGAVGNGRDWAMEYVEANDPVNVLFDQQFDAGHANNFTMSLAYNLGTEEEDGILQVNRAVPPCDETGKLEISWEPCMTKLVDGVRVVDEGEEPEQVDDPAEMVGHPWAAKLKIKKWHTSPMMCTSAYVMYDFYNESNLTTETKEYDDGTNNPEWEYEKLHYIPSVSHDFLQWLQNAAIQFTIVMKPKVREHGSGQISTDNPTVVENTKAIMKLGKMDQTGGMMNTTTSVTLPAIADKTVEKAWKDHVLSLTTQLQSAQAQIAKLLKGGGAGNPIKDDAEALSYFAALDANSDGNLSATELHCGLSDLGFGEDDISELITKLDVNKDGLITKHEFVSNYGVYKEFTQKRSK
jgi:Ca2+-binding EF-hand superfamily protein